MHFLLFLLKMEDRFKVEVDEWIKKLNKDVTDIPDMKKCLLETIDNTQHNYELIYELKDEIEDLKQELNALKLIQILSLKKGDKQLNDFDLVKLKGYLGGGN